MACPTAASTSADFAWTEPKLRAGETIEVSVDVVNHGPLAGEETVLLFIRDQVSSITRPLLELKDFEKISLAAGESGTIRFTPRRRRSHFSRS